MTDSLFQRIGAMPLPAKATDVDNTALTLAPLDPARDAILGCLKAAVNFELSAAWNKVVAVIPSLATKSPVQDTWPGMPSPTVVLQRACDFPCLFLARDGIGKFGDYSLSRRQLTQTWGLHYIISPVDVGDERKIQDILVRVGGVVLATIERGGHSAFASGGVNALRSVGLNTLFLKTIQSGQARFAGNADENAPSYHALSCELESTEIMREVDGVGTPFTGASLELGTGNSEGIIPTLVEAQTY